MELEDAGMSVKFVLHDRDASFTAAFDAVFQAAGARVVRSAIQAPRMNSIMERRIGSCRRELLDRILVWNQHHLMTVLREYEDFCNTHRPHRTLSQAAPLRPVPDGVTDLDQFRVRRRDRAGGMIHEYRLAYRFSAPQPRGTRRRAGGGDGDAGDLEGRGGPAAGVPRRGFGDRGVRGAAGRGPPPDQGRPARRRR
jgi:integrase-like protein